jgi:methionyl-tRNA synthetase
MPSGVAITPEELATAFRVYMETGVFAKAARAIGKDASATARALRRHPSKPERASVYARELDAVMSEAARLQRVALARLRPMLSDADAKVAQGAVAQVNDTSRAAGTARTALAKLTGEHAAEKVEVAVDDDALLAKLSRVTGR